MKYDDRTRQPTEHAATDCRDLPSASPLAVLEPGGRATRPVGRQRAVRALLALGTMCAISGLTIIWAARLSTENTMYVSELGATGAPTAGPFAIALLLIAAGGVTIALTGRHVRSSVRLLNVWGPAASLGFAAGCFALASQVTCTANCPVPFVDPRSTPQDLIHTVAAVLGFVAACFAMLQVAFSSRHPRVARFSLASCVAVAVITVMGGLLAIVRVATNVGAWLELIGTTVAIVWIAVYSLSRIESCAPTGFEPAPAS